MKMKMVILLSPHYNLVHTNQTITDILICIGPEGGYQEKEINAIIESDGNQYRWAILFYEQKQLPLDH